MAKSKKQAARPSRKKPNPKTKPPARRRKTSKTKKPAKRTASKAATPAKRTASKAAAPAKRTTSKAAAPAKRRLAPPRPRPSVARPPSHSARKPHAPRQPAAQSRRRKFELSPLSQERQRAVDALLFRVYRHAAKELAELERQRVIELRKRDEEVTEVYARARADLMGRLARWQAAHPPEPEPQPEGGNNSNL